MGDFFGSIWWLIVSLGVLVTFHEFGHYWVARRCGVRVLRFSVGFGRPLWRRLGRDGTEYVVAAIPLGGYVKFLDEREGEVAPDERQQAFNTQSVGRRFAIVAAGPLFNLLLAVLLLWLMFMVGKSDFAPVLGEVSGIAAKAGLQLDDRVQQVDGEPIDSWTHLGMALTTAALDRRDVELVIERENGSRALTLPLGELDAVDERNVLRAIGVLPRSALLAPEVGSLTAGGAAAAAGLQVGDRIVSIDGQQIEWWHDISRVLASREPAGQPEPAQLVIARGAERLQFTVTPQWSEHRGRSSWMLGIGSPPRDPRHVALLRHGPIDAFGQSLKETWRLTEATFGMLWRMATGVASLKNISGPVTIATTANASASLGLAWFLFFLAVLSLSLCIMNLLPIPILDGGHLLYYLIEIIKGSPVSERMLVAGQYVGLAMLAGLMGLAFYNDFLGVVN